MESFRNILLGWSWKLLLRHSRSFVYMIIKHVKQPLPPEGTEPEGGEAQVWASACPGGWAQVTPAASRLHTHMWQPLTHKPHTGRPAAHCELSHRPGARCPGGTPSYEEPSHCLVVCLIGPLPSGLRLPCRCRAGEGTGLSLSHTR